MLKPLPPQIDKMGRPAIANRLQLAVWRLGLVITASLLVTVINAPAQPAASKDGQTAQVAGIPNPSFEVASIKPNHSKWGGMNATFAPLHSPHYSATNVSVKWLIRNAYDMQDFQISGGPKWIDSAHYDIEADIEPSTFEQLRQRSRIEQSAALQAMLQSLLADRFGLEVTKKTIQLPGYALVGIKKSDSKLDALSVTALPGNPDGLIVLANYGSGKISIDATAVSLHNLAEAISRAEQRRVYDRTAFTGNYTFKLTWTEVPIAATGEATDSFAPSLASVLRDDLGLKLESITGLVDSIVITRVEEPSPN